jgi:hypothetical protein
MAHNALDAKSVVLELFEKILCRPSSNIKGTDRFDKDLRMAGDDFGMWLVPELETRLGIKPSMQEWNQVETVNDLVKVIERHLQLTLGPFAEGS